VLDDDIFVTNVANGVSCSLSSFKKIIEEIETRFSFSLDLDDPATVTVTFDDGYCNQAEVAAPYLISKGIPAYLFVSGQLISDDDGKCMGALTIDKLLHWVSYVPVGNYEITIFDRKLSFYIDDDNRNTVWETIFWPLYLEDAVSKGENLLYAVDAVFSFSALVEKLSQEYVRQRLTGVTVGELDKLKENGWQIGWHTKSHYPVSRLTEYDKRAELDPPLNVCNSAVLSLPYGGPDDVDDAAVMIIEKLGFTSALSNVNIANRFSGNWYRSRMALSDDKAMLHFELSGLKYMLKYRKLLSKI